MNKICKKCLKSLSFKCFYRCKHTKDNKQSWCINCIKNEAKRYLKTHKLFIKLKAKKTRKLMPWVEYYYGLRKRCNNIKHQDYKRYGGRGIKAKITKSEIKYLWFRDKAYLMKQPSIDRINSDGHYELNNCRFIEMIENARLGSLKCARPIKQIGLDNKIIRRWNSISEAVKTLQICESTLIRCLKQKTILAGNYKWEYI